MPNRILRDGILSSEKVNQLSWPAEVFYRRLISVVDDFARFDGRLSVIRASTYPLQLDKVGDSDIEKWILETEEAALVRRYAVEGKPYVLLLNFRQNTRAKASKYPAPLHTCNPDDEHTRSTCTACAYVYGDGYEDGYVYGDVGRTRAEVSAPAAVKVPELTDEQWLESLKSSPAYEGIDVGREYGKMLQWCSIRKKQASRKRFVNWLNRCDLPMFTGTPRSANRGPNI